MTDVAEIAKGLTTAQRACLLSLPTAEEFRPLLTGFRWPTLAVLKSKRFILAIRPDFEGAGKGALHRVTATGEQVRNHLLETQNA